MKFSERLKEQRLENKLTQKQVAKLLGVSPTCYSGYECGYREPDFKTLIEICKVLKVSADWLLGLDE